MRHKVTLIAGEGIGPEVAAATRRIIEASGVLIDWEEIEGRTDKSNDQGQLLNASLADYLLPTALEVPRVELGHTVTKSPLNPMGIKGAGEAGAIPVGALFAQAIEEALDLKRRGVELLEIPLSPSRLFELTRNARG